MRYHSIAPYYYTTMYGETYICSHPVYDSCTLFKEGKKGLAVIQQRFNYANKSTYWGELDKWIPDKLYLNENFGDYFRKNADYPKNGLYPTVPLRKLMWALKMKPLPKERWETTFDRRLV